MIAEQLTTLRGRSAIVTGASGGIGRAIALALGEAQCRVFLTGRRTDALLQLRDEMTSLGYAAACGVAELDDSDQIEAILSSAREFLGGVDILVNSAGAFLTRNVAGTSLEDFDRIYRTNVRAPFLLARAVSEEMIARRWGRIVHIGSSSAHHGFRNTSAYCASKHALLGLSRALHDELKSFNVRCYCISPGTTDTEMGRQVPGIDSSTLMRPAEVAQYVVFVMSFDGNLTSDEIELHRVVRHQ